MPTLDEIKFLREMFASIPDSRDYKLPSEYIEEVRYLPSELTPKPGYFDYDFVPYAREIVDHFHPLSPTRKIVWMKPAQIAATTAVLESAIAYNIGLFPCSVLFVSADKELAEKGMDVKIERMLDSCDLRERIFAQTKGGNSRKTGDTRAEKEYPGGFLHGIGARNPGKLRQMSYQWILFDELDGFPDTVGNEGDPLMLAENRSSAFAKKRKILYLSTPTILQTSKINRMFLMGDQRLYHTPCPRCGEMIVTQWHVSRDDQTTAGIKYETDEGILIPESVHYECQKCRGKILEEEKADYLIEGKWIPTARSQEEGLVSYWNDATIAPPETFSWVNMVYDWLKAWDPERGKVKDLDQYRSFRNTKQGLPFEERGESLVLERVLLHRRHGYARNQIPNKMAIEETGSPIFKVTCMVDVQKSPGRLIVDIKAWARNAVSYTLDYREIMAESDVTDIHDTCWRKLEEIIERETWTAKDGRSHGVGITFIDAAWGESTDTVYQFARQYSQNVYPTFGANSLRDGITLMPVSKATQQQAGCMAFRINVGKMKDRVTRMMNASWYAPEKQPMFYMNFPDDMGEEYFMQFTAESKVPIYDKRTNQFKGFEWKLVQGRDNHALDLAGYHFAALELVAEDTCLNIMGLDSLSWPEFFDYMDAEVRKG